MSDKEIPLSLRISGELVLEIDEIAAEVKRSRNNAMELLLALGIEQYKVTGQLLAPRRSRPVAESFNSELQRIAHDEGKHIEEMCAEIADLLGVDARSIYNYRSGRWQLPASLIPLLAKRFNSDALKRALAEDQSQAAKMINLPVVQGNPNDRKTPQPQAKDAPVHERPARGNTRRRAK